MVPSFFAGMRLGMSGVLLGVLLAELYVSIAGIGYFTTLFTQNFEPTKLLGLIGVLAAMAIALNAAGAARRGPFRQMARRMMMVRSS
jgi:ABC-type nitrate/sulfonate/bicarbonate transport system permease component